MRIVFILSCIALLQCGFLPNPTIAEVQRDPSSIVRESVDRVLAEITEHKENNGNAAAEHKRQHQRQ